MPRFEALAHVCLWSCVLIVFVKCFSSFSLSLRIKSVAHLFLDRLRINSVVHLFLERSCCVGNSFSRPGNGIYFVTLVHRSNIGDSLCTGGLFIVFLAVFNYVIYTYIKRKSQWNT